MRNVMPRRRRKPKEKEIEYLVNLAKDKGYLTFDEISNLFDEKTVWSPFLEDILGRLEERGIKVVDGMGKSAQEMLDDFDEEVEIETEEVVYTGDPVRAYLREISKIPLLTQKEEIQLARRIEEKELEIRKIEKELGFTRRRLKRLYKELKDKKIKKRDLPGTLRRMRKSEFFDIVERIYSIEDEIRMIKKRFIEANLRLVVSIAKRYVHRKLSILDLVDEGNLGLIRAVDKFDYKEGFRFSTYASWWIRQAITRAIAEQTRTIRVPVYMSEKINHFLRVSKDLVQELGREPTVEEVAERMKLSVEKVLSIIRISQEPTSLETPIGEEEADELGELIQDKQGLSPSAMVFVEMLADRLRKVLEDLPDRERDILKLRYGLEGERQHTLSEIGKRLGITRERVRQLESKALSKLRKMKVAQELRDFLTE
jgi:RNA polymerase primary sigma factor